MDGTQERSYRRGVLSPFDESGDTLALNGRVTLRHGVTVAMLRLSTLRWALLRSALWPSITLRAIIPPGRYKVEAILSPISAAPVRSKSLNIVIGEVGKHMK